MRRQSTGLSTDLENSLDEGRLSVDSVRADCIDPDERNQQATPLAILEPAKTPLLRLRWTLIKHHRNNRKHGVGPRCYGTVKLDLASRTSTLAKAGLRVAYKQFFLSHFLFTSLLLSFLSFGFSYISNLLLMGSDLFVYYLP
jgi:hypothetical protein